jgi:hypothetical protein
LTDFLSKGTKKWKDKGQNGLFFLEELVKTEAGGWAFGPGLLLFLGVNADFFWRLCCP